MINTFYVKLRDFMKENLEIIFKSFKDYMGTSLSNRVKSCLTLINVCYA